MSRFGKVFQLGKDVIENNGKVLVKEGPEKGFGKVAVKEVEAIKPLNIPVTNDIPINSNKTLPTYDTPRPQGYGIIKGNRIIQEGTAGLNPLNSLKSIASSAEDMRQGLVEYLADKTTSYLPEASKQVSQEQAKEVLDEGLNPLNYAGGAGAVDAALSTGSMLSSYKDKLKKILGD